MMNRRAFGLALAAGAGAVVLSCASEPPQLPSLREVIGSNATFGTFARALDQAGLQSLGDAGPFTVFAPTDSAFAKLPPHTVDRLMLPENRGELLRLVQLHVVQGRFAAADLADRTTTLTTLSGLPIVVDGLDRLHVGGARVVQPDVMARNGVLHVIDGVLLPPKA